MTDALTITRLALNIFKKKYYNNIKIPTINKKVIIIGLFILILTQKESLRVTNIFKLFNIFFV